MMNKVEYLFLMMRPPLMVLGFLAPVALIIWVGKGVFEGLLIVSCIGTYNICANMMNEWQDRFDDLKKKNKTPPALHLNWIMVRSVVSVLLAISVVSLIILTVSFDWIYGVIGVVGLSGGIIYNVLRRKDLVGNIVLGLVYGCASLMAVYPDNLLFPIAFGLFTITHNVGVQVQDLGHETIVTIPSQVGRSNAVLVSIVLGVISSYIFILNGLYLFSVVPALAVLGSLLFLIFKSKRIYEIVLRIGARVMLLICFLVMIFLNI